MAEQHHCYQLCSRELIAALHDIAEQHDPRMFAYMAQYMGSPDIFELEIESQKPPTGRWASVPCRHGLTYWARPGERHMRMVRRIDRAVQIMFSE